MRTVRDVSAGGVVLRREGDTWQVVVVGGGERGRWGLPKGAQRRRESLEGAALREVAEETGLEVRLRGPLGSIEYVFVAAGVRHWKRVHFFRMEAVGGDLAAHDAEHEEAVWLPVDEAMQRMTYEAEKKVVRDAIRAAEAELARTREKGDGVAVD